MLTHLYLILSNINANTFISNSSHFRIMSQSRPSRFNYDILRCMAEMLDFGSLVKLRRVCQWHHSAIKRIPLKNLDLTGFNLMDDKNAASLVSNFNVKWLSKYGFILFLYLYLPLQVFHITLIIYLLFLYPF